METTLPSAIARRNFVIFSLLFNSALIIWALWQGDDSNSLHTSALAWAFVTWIATFSAYVFGAVWENVVLARKA